MRAVLALAALGAASAATNTISTAGGWYASADNWSLTRFPRHDDSVVVEAALVIGGSSAAKPSYYAGATEGEVVEITSDGVVEIAAGDGDALEIGPQASAPENCVVGMWGDWNVDGVVDECTEECDGGTQSRSRTNTQPRFGGDVCPVNNQEDQPCNEQMCIPVPTGTCQHVACARVAHEDHFKIKVYHTTNNAEGAHGPRAENKHPQCLDSSNLVGCQDSEAVYHECSWNADTEQCECLCDKVVATVPPTTTTTTTTTTPTTTTTTTTTPYQHTCWCHHGTPLTGEACNNYANQHGFTDPGVCGDCPSNMYLQGGGCHYLGSCSEASYDGSASMGPSNRYFSNPFGQDNSWEKKFNTNTKHYLTYAFASAKRITKATMKQYGRSCSSVSEGCCTSRQTFTAHGKTMSNFCADYSGDRYAGYSGAYCANIKIQYSDDGSSFSDASTWPAQVGDNTFTWTQVGAHRYWRLLCDDTTYNGGNPNQWQGNRIGLYTGHC